MEESAPKPLKKRRGKQVDFIKNATETTKALRRLRVSKMVEDRILGMSVINIGKKYNVAPATVRKELDFARTSGVIESLEDRILKELVPLAIDTYKFKMKEDKDAFVAKDVLTNLARLSEKQERKQKDDDSNSLEAYLKIRTSKQPPNPNLPPPSSTTEIITLAKDFTKSLTSRITEEDQTESDVIDVAAHSPTDQQPPTIRGETLPIDETGE